MIWSFTKREILDSLVSARFFLLSGLMLVLVTVSIVVGYGDFAERMEDYALLRPEQNASNIIIEPNPVSIFVQGLSSHLDRGIEAWAFGLDVHSSQHAINRLFTLFTVPDLLFVIRVVLALIAILFTFDAMCGEKEGGTLKLTLSCGGSRMALLAGKLLGRWLIVIVPFTLVLLLGSIIVSQLPLVAAGGYYWGRITAMMLSAGLYAGVFVSIGVLLSILASRASTSLILGLSCWALCVFVIPNIGTTAAEMIMDVPPSEQVDLQNRMTAISNIFDAVQRQQRNRDPHAFEGVGERLWKEKLRFMEAYSARLNAQVRLAKTFCRFSPAGAMVFLLSDLSNTGLMESIDRKERIVEHVARVMVPALSQDKAPKEPFNFVPTPLTDILIRSAGFDIAVLVIFLTLALGLSMISFRTLDPR